MPDSSSRFPAWLIIGVAAVLAFPFGWGLGLVLAVLIAGREFGQLPAATIPLGLLGGLGLAFWPTIKPVTRLKLLTVGTFVFLVFAWLET